MATLELNTWRVTASAVICNCCGTRYQKEYEQPFVGTYIDPESGEHFQQGVLQQFGCHFCGERALGRKFRKRKALHADFVENPRDVERLHGAFHEFRDRFLVEEVRPSPISDAFGWVYRMQDGDQLWHLAQFHAVYEPVFKQKSALARQPPLARCVACHQEIPLVEDVMTPRGKRLHAGCIDRLVRSLPPIASDVHDFVADYRGYPPWWSSSQQDGTFARRVGCVGELLAATGRCHHLLVDSDGIRAALYPPTEGGTPGDAQVELVEIVELRGGRWA